MNFKIIEEKVIKPIPLTFPTQNNTFLNVTQASTTLAKPDNNSLTVFMHEDAYRSMWYHVKKDLRNELGGALLGYYAQDPDTKREFIVITDILNQPIEYHTDPTLLRFTRQFYGDLEEYIDFVNQKYPNILRLGLYHTHPGYGIFMSRTDVSTFKGIFKDKFQIAQIVDPVSNEDGVFVWMKERVSPKTGYYLFDTKKADFQPHKAPTTNPLVAKYNFQTQHQSVQQAPPDLPRLHLKPKPRQAIEDKEVLKLNIKSDYVPSQPLKFEKETLHLENQYFQYATCPLYDFRYKNQELKLYRYFQPLKQTLDNNPYPFLVFFDEKIKTNVENYFEENEEAQEVIGILKGSFYKDKLKNLLFVDLQNIELEELTKDLFLFNYVALIVEKYRQEQALQHDQIGWMAVTKKKIPDAFHFIQKHEMLFQHNHNLGIIVKINENNQLDLENSYFVAYNFDKNTPFDYFKQLFLYKKMY